VIQDGNFASEGFSQTWQPHLWRIKATPMVNAQEYSQIIDQPFMPENIWDPGNFYPAGEIVNNGGTYYQAAKNVPPGTDISNPAYWTEITDPATRWRSSMSTRPKDLAINDACYTGLCRCATFRAMTLLKFYILPTEGGQPASSGLAYCRRHYRFVTVMRPERVSLPRLWIYHGIPYW
jgi:hypothetical protein